MTFYKSFALKLAYLFLAGGLALGTQACQKKTFSALNNGDVDPNATGSSSSSGGASNTTTTTTGGNNNGTGNTVGNTTGATNTTTTGNTSGTTTSGTTTGGTTTSGTTSGGTTTSGTTSGGSTTSGTTVGGTTTSGTTVGGTTTSGTTTGATTSATTGATTNTPDPERYCILEKYKQPSAIITKKLDVLIVTDSSSSMDAERAALANGVTNYISKLPSDINARFAVMLGHGPTSWFSGRLYKSDFMDPREKFVISTEDWSTTDIKKWMNRKLRYRQKDYNVRAFTNTDIAVMDPTKGALGLPSDLEADGGEAGLFSLNEALRDYTEGPAARYKSIQNLAGGTESSATERNFFRPDAALAVIFISDENDLCYKDPSVPDDDNLEVPFYNANCANITAEKILQRLQTLRQSLPLYVSSIIYNKPGQVPAGLENGIGYGYNKITQLASGTIIDITNGTGAIPTGLSTIGAFASSILNLRYDFILKYAGVDSTTIQAKADVGGNNAFTTKAHSYSSSTNTVHINDPGVANSNVHINYCLNPGAPLTPYQVQISNYLIQKSPKTYQPDVVITKE